jgi:hypothetical protein
MLMPKAARLALLVASGSLMACASAIVRPAVVPETRRSDALLVLPGFGYSRDGEKALRSLAASMATEGIELFVPTYISRGGLAESRAHLRRFIDAQRLDRYDHLHVFAFLAGAWTFNPLVEVGALPNLATVVYDRSPYQERGPKVADEALHFLTWLRYGSPVFDVARTPYAPLTRPNVRVGIMVETVPTALIKRHETLVRSYGPIRFECAALMQRYDDCLYLPLSHNELYVRFAAAWPDLLTFIRDGRFTGAANRTPPPGDPLAESHR